MKRTKRHRHGSRNRSQSRRSRKPGFTFYIPAPPSPPLPPGQPATQEGSKRARAVALDYCLVQRWTYLGAFKRKRTFSSPSCERGREREREREGGGRTRDWIRRRKEPKRGGTVQAEERTKKNFIGARCYPSVHRVGHRESEKRSGGDAVWCNATNAHFSPSFTPHCVAPFILNFLHRLDITLKIIFI